MSELNQRVLVVDGNPEHLEMNQQFLSHFNSISVETAAHPDQAKELISKNDPFSIIWSDYDFGNSAIDGIEFMGDVSLASPLSARLLCTGTFSETELITLVRDKIAHTYISKPISTKSVHSGLEIGFANHKLNLLQHTFEEDDLNSSQCFERTRKYFKETRSIIESSKLKGFALDDRGLELKQLRNKSEGLIQSFNESFQRSNESMDQRNADIQIHDDHIQNINTLTEQRDNMIQRLKDDFGF